eukprot:178056_1
MHHVITLRLDHWWRLLRLGHMWRLYHRQGLCIDRSYMAKSMTSTTNPSAHGSVGKYIKTDVQNGVIGEHVSLAIAETLYIFWHKNIDRLPREEQLEIGCSIYFTMMGSSEDMKHILWNRGNSNNQH